VEKPTKSQDLTRKTLRKFYRKRVHNSSDSESQDAQVHPRSRKIRSKIGTGIPRSHSKIYPVAPVSSILCFKCIIEFWGEIGRH